MSGNLPAYFFHAKNRIHVNSTIKLDRTQVTRHNERQRRMGVEPTRDRAERPPSRFEDGETHRGPYTSVYDVGVFCHSCPNLSSKLSNLLHTYLGQTFNHQFCCTQSRQITIPSYGYAAHSSCVSRLHACYGVLNHQAVLGFYT